MSAWTTDNVAWEIYRHNERKTHIIVRLLWLSDQQQQCIKAFKVGRGQSKLKKDFFAFRLTEYLIFLRIDPLYVFSDLGSALKRIFLGGEV